MDSCSYSCSCTFKDLSFCHFAVFGSCAFDAIFQIGSAALAYFYSAQVEDLMEFMTFGEVLLY